MLLDGDLPLRYYSGSFALRRPTWRLPGDGGVRTLVSASSLDDELGRGNLGGCWVEELEGSGRECDSPRKRPVHWFGVVGNVMLCMVGDGNVFMFLGMLWALGTAVLRGDAYHCVIMGIFLGLGWGSSTPGCCTVPRLQGVHGAFRS